MAESPSIWPMFRVPKDLTKVSDAAYLRALAAEVEAGVLGGAHPEQIAARLREIAEQFDGSQRAEEEFTQRIYDHLTEDLARKEGMSVEEVRQMVPLTALIDGPGDGS